MRKRVFVLSVFLLSFCFGLTSNYIFLSKPQERRVSDNKSPKYYLTDPSSQKYRIYMTEIEWFNSSQYVGIYRRYGRINLAIFGEKEKFILANFAAHFIKYDEVFRLTFDSCTVYLGRWKRNLKGGVKTNARFSTKISLDTAVSRMSVQDDKNVPPLNTVWTLYDFNGKALKGDAFSSFENILKADSLPFSDTSLKYVRLTDKIDLNLNIEKLLKE